MKFTDYEKQNPNFDLFDDYLPEIVDSEDQDECKANILYAIQETAGLPTKDIYEAIKNVVESYYGGIAFNV